MLNSTWQTWKSDQERKPAIWFMHQQAGCGPEGATSPSGARSSCKECLFYRWRRMAASGGGWFAVTRCEKARSDVDWAGFWLACGLFFQNKLKAAVESANK